jgi:hypothetical protein
VGVKHQETASCLHQPIRSVGPANWSSAPSSSHVALSDTALAAAPYNVDEALAEIECQRELTAELMRLGQPTEEAELALNGMLREFASMIEYECGTLAEGLRIKRSAQWGMGPWGMGPGTKPITDGQF